MKLSTCIKYHILYNLFIPGGVVGFDQWDSHFAVCAVSRTRSADEDIEWSCLPFTGRFRPSCTAISQCHPCQVSIDTNNNIYQCRYHLLPPMIKLNINCLLSRIAHQFVQLYENIVERLEDGMQSSNYVILVGYPWNGWHNDTFLLSSYPIFLSFWLKRSPAYHKFWYQRGLF